MLTIQSATYSLSTPNLKGCPEPVKAEFAFIGRSNVGKSSLINMVLNKRGLALTSSKPGKTKFINYFLIKSTPSKINGTAKNQAGIQWDEWYVVDLPGYGYAQTSQTQRATWRKNLEEYLIKRTSLANVFLLIDANIPPQKKDIEFINWLGSKRIPFSLVFTKSDKPKPLALKKNIDAMHVALQENWEALPPEFITSANTGLGRDALLDYIQECISLNLA